MYNFVSTIKMLSISRDTKIKEDKMIRRAEIIEGIRAE